jgi:hypothetical protein
MVSKSQVPAFCTADVSVGVADVTVEAPDGAIPCGSAAAHC